MSVDFGSEWMKIGIVSPGVPMEIVLNKESKRKTPTILTIRNDDRTFGEDAQTIGMRFPKSSYQYLLDLLGKGINHPIVKLYRERFPYYEIVEDSERGTILFKHNEELYFSPEELIAQLLQQAKHFAEESSGQKIKECVLTVPGYFNQVERKALLQAAEIAGLKVLQLVNNYMAFALNYGIFRTKDFNDTAQYVMFYDMGASSTTAAIVSLQNTKTKERGFVETHPQISIIGVGYDRTLGGLEIQVRLRNFLARKFNDMKKTTGDVFENPRAMAKLFKEAGRVKNILSANADHFAQIEGLLDDKDFRIQVTRDELENMISDLSDRVGNPVYRALKTAGLSMDVVSQVVLVGGGTRVPKIQEKLQEIVGQDLAKNLNADEAATLGAVYKAADLSSGFRVKKFITKDTVLFPIQIVFRRDSDGEVRQVKRMLFGLMNPYPQKKLITFNKHVDDFSFNVNYAELDYLPTNEILNIGSVNLTTVSVAGVAGAIKKNAGENIEPKGIKAHFFLDDSGILKLVNVEYVVEKTVTEEVEEEGAFSKLGSTISKLFSGEPEKEETQGAPERQQDTEQTPDAVNPQNGTTDKNATEGKQSNDTLKENKPKVLTIKEPLEVTQKILTISEMNKLQFEKSEEKLNKLDDVEKLLNRKAQALNNLESFVVEVQNKLYENEYVEASTDDEIRQIQAACSEVSDWLYEDGSDADAETYESKLENLHSLTNNLYIRVYEHRERPEALKALSTMLNGSSNFLESAKNLTKSNNPDKDVFTEVEINTLEKIIRETNEWMIKEIEEQDKLKKSDSVRLTINALSEKMAALDREVKYLVNKIKLWKPKNVDKTKDSKSDKEERMQEGEIKGDDETGRAEDQQEEGEKAKDGTAGSEAAKEKSATGPNAPEDERAHSEL